MANNMISADFANKLWNLKLCIIVIIPVLPVLIVGVALVATQTKGYGSDIKYVLDSNGLLTKQA